MSRQQEFWETLKLKYEEKNQALQRREHELRLKLEAMDQIIGDSAPKVPPASTTAKPSMNKTPSALPSVKASVTKPESVFASLTEEEKSIISHHLSEAGVTGFPDNTCPCPPPAERAGFFKCFFSIFGSSKPKPPESSAPQTPPVPMSVAAAAVASPASHDMPTKLSKQSKPSYKELEIQKMTSQPQNKVTNYDNNPYKNEGCMCQPCIVDIPEQFVASTPANIVQRASKDSNKNTNGDLCDCSICTRSVSSGVQPEQRTVTNQNDLCYCYSNVGKKSQDAVNDDGCSCTEAEVASSKANARSRGAASTSNKVSNNDFNNSNISSSAAKLTGKSGFNIPSNLSLKSVDLFYMKNIHDLATQQKNLVNEINSLEQKAKIYDDVFKEYKNIDFSARDRQAVCCSCNDASSSSDPNQKTSAELKLENFLLKNELKDMRLEVRQYLERMEGPMQYKIESERYKCIQLEEKLAEVAKEMASVQEFYQKEINSLKMQLCTANTSIYNLTAMTEQLQQDLQTAQQKCAKLEDDLIRQKLSEAETIMSLKAALNNQMEAAGPAKDECDLHQIARELSKILRECEPCGECMNLPEDLTAAAKLLKSLTDMVNGKLTEHNEDYEQQETTSAGKLDAGASYGAGSAAAAPAADTMAFKVSQEIRGQPIEEKTSSVKPQSIESKPSHQSGAGEPQIEETASSVKPQSVHSKQSEVEGQPQLEPKESEGEKPETNEEKGPEGEPQPEEKVPSVKSEPQNVTINNPEVSSRKSYDSGHGDEKPDKNADQTSQRSNKEDVAIDKSEVAKPIEGRSKSKTSCKCVRSKKSTEVDQLWPKDTEPLLMKDSSVIETVATPSKKKCDCKIAKKLRETQGEQQAMTKSLTASGKKPCKCNKKSADEVKPLEVTKSEPQSTDRFRLSHQVTASKSKDLLKSETSVKCLKVKENFPFDIDTQVDVIDRPPDGVHVTTTITNSGTLEVITEGPEGVIETTLIYTNSGNVEVVTEILEFQKKGKGCKRGAKTRAIEGPDVKALEAPGLKTCLSAPGTTPVSAARLEAPRSGPSILNPNCQCGTVCPDLEKAQTTPQDDVKEDEPKRSPSGRSPNCQCRDCPVLEVAQPAKPEGDVKPEAPAAAKAAVPAANCPCVDCPGLGETQAQKPAELKEVVADQPPAPEDTAATETIDVAKEDAPAIAEATDEAKDPVEEATVENTENVKVEDTTDQIKVEDVESAEETPPAIENTEATDENNTPS